MRPDWKEGWWALGTILYDQESHAAAARAFRRLLVLDPKNGTAHLMLALCEYQVERDASAMEHIQAAKKLGVQKDGELPHVLSYHEAMLLLRGGRYERALEVLQPLVAAGVDEENLDLALGMGVLLMRPKDAPLEGSPDRADRAARGSRRASPSGQGIRRGERGLRHPGAGGPDVPERSLRVRPLPARDRAILTAAWPSFWRKSTAVRTTSAPACRSPPRGTASIQQQAYRSPPKS